MYIYINVYISKGYSTLQSIHQPTYFTINCFLCFILLKLSHNFRATYLAVYSLFHIWLTISYIKFCFFIIFLYFVFCAHGVIEKNDEIFMMLSTRYSSGRLAAGEIKTGNQKTRANWACGLFSAKRLAGHGSENFTFTQDSRDSLCVPHPCSHLSFSFTEHVWHFMAFMRFAQKYAKKKGRFCHCFLSTFYVVNVNWSLTCDERKLLTDNVEISLEF